MKQIKKLRGDLRSLKKQSKAACTAEKPPLEELCAILRRKLKDICRVEGHRRRRKERVRKRASFFKNPFGFSRKLLRDRKSGNLNGTLEEMNSHLNETYRTNARI